MLPLTPLSTLQADLASGKTTSRDLVESCLDRALSSSGEGSRVFVHIDADGARKAADEIDTRRREGKESRPLAGIPVSIKDLFDIEGQVTTAGSVVLADQPPATRDAEAVARLRAAGLVIVGRSNMTEFAYSGLGINPHYGTPASAFDRLNRRIPGGSSSGAAISVTDGMAAAGLGTDTGGSCRIPAALNGITGFKPTAAGVPAGGAFPLSDSLDSIGPLAPTAACCAALHEILSGATLDRAQIALGTLRLAVPQTVVLDGLDAHVSATFAAALSRLSSAGVRVDDLPLNEFGELAGLNAKGGLIAAEAYAAHQARLDELGTRYDPRVSVRMAKGATQSAADYLQLLAARKDWIRRVNARMDGHDLLVCPTVPTIAPTMAELEDEEAYGRVNLAMLRNPTFANFFDGCAISVPCHAPGSAPVGLMLIGRHGDDARVLAAAQAIQALF